MRLITEREEDKDRVACRTFCLGAWLCCIGSAINRRNYRVARKLGGNFCFDCLWYSCCLSSPLAAKQEWDDATRYIGYKKKEEALLWEVCNLSEEKLQELQRNRDELAARPIPVQPVHEQPDGQPIQTHEHFINTNVADNRN
jgi:hypothetical protein